MSENNHKMITVKLKKAGWEVEITCSEDQVKNAVESVLASLSASQATQTLAAPLDSDQRQSGGSKKTVRGLISELFQESWFSEPRSLAEVYEEIARRGYHYDKSAVSHSLTDLVREGVLSRQGDARAYSYVQKKPVAATTAGQERFRTDLADREIESE